MKDTRWAVHDWNGDDRPYTALEAQIKRELKQGQSASQLVAKYKTAALRAPTNPQAQFAWADAEREATLLKGQQWIPPDALTAFLKADPQNVHEYARLRLVITEEAEPNTYHPELTTAGLRLLNANHADNFVKSALIYDLTNSRQMIGKGLSLAKEWTSQEPLSAKAHSVLAFVYQSLWEWNNQAAYADKSISEYKVYLSLAPPNDPFRKTAEYLIKTIHKNRLNP